MCSINNWINNGEAEEPKTISYVHGFIAEMAFDHFLANAYYASHSSKYRVQVYLNVYVIYF